MTLKWNDGDLPLWDAEALDEPTSQLEPEDHGEHREQGEDEEPAQVGVTMAPPFWGTTGASGVTTTETASELMNSSASRTTQRTGKPWPTRMVYASTKVSTWYW